MLRNFFITDVDNFYAAFFIDSEITNNLIPMMLNSEMIFRKINLLKHHIYFFRTRKTRHNELVIILFYFNIPIKCLVGNIRRLNGSKSQFPSTWLIISSLSGDLLFVLTLIIYCDSNVFDAATSAPVIISIKLMSFKMFSSHERS